jgi:hypothetical protein
MNGLGVNLWRLQYATEHILSWFSAVSEDLKADGALVPWAGGRAAFCYYGYVRCMFAFHPLLTPLLLSQVNFQQLR